MARAANKRSGVSRIRSKYKTTRKANRSESFCAIIMSAMGRKLTWGGGPAPSRPGDLRLALVLYSTELRAAAPKHTCVRFGWKADNRLAASLGGKLPLGNLV